MHIIGAELLERTNNLKFILNEGGIVFFPATQQHRNIKVHGLSYEDDYRGNAVAGIVMPGRVEVRYHNAFSDERIRSLWTRVLKIPEVAGAGLGQLYYQGREIVSDAAR